MAPTWTTRLLLQLQCLWSHQPCRPGSRAEADCVVEWPWVEAGGRHRPPLLLPPHHSSACLKRRTWTRFRCSGPRCAYAAERSESWILETVKGGDVCNAFTTTM